MGPRMIHRRVAILAVVVTAITAPALRAQDPKAQVLQVGQAVFDAMAQRDTAALRQVLHPAAHLIAAVESDGQPAPRASDLSEFLDQIANFPTVPLERIWNAEVRVSGTVATIWAQYDFHRGIEFSHCGIDSFQLVKTPAGWRVSSIIYTVIRDRCPKNPMGPPR